MTMRLLSARCAVACTMTILTSAAAAGQSSVPPVIAAGDHESAPHLPAVRTAGSLQIDGSLDEDDWSQAVPASMFTQIMPDEAQPASERTEVRILYDDVALYIGARLHDAGPVTTRLGRRDMAPGDSDWFGVILDSHHDHQTGYAFFVNPSGVRRDDARTEGSGDPSWDAVWEAAVQQDDGGWTAELRIPFSQLRFNAADVQTWGIQLERVIRRHGELAVFAFTPRREQAGPGRFGHLGGLEGLSRGKPLELMPYTVMRTERVDRGVNPFRERGESAMSAGLDLKYRITSNLTADATINPDFGQVEVDPAVVNLSALETFYQEKRPFFLEGAGIFDFGNGAVGPGGSYRNLFYTRRIGRRPQLGAGVPQADAPDATRILGAAKVTGRPSGWSLGVMQALTQEATGRYRDAAGADHEYTAEPLTSYLVARGMRTLRQGQTRVGLIGTAVNRDLDDDRAASLLRSSAYTGGVDFSHEWSRRMWRFSGFAAGSHVRGDSSAIAFAQRSPLRYYQRPDATSFDVDPGATSLTGFVGQVQLFKQAGLHWMGDVSVYTVSPGYEVNDLGFQSRADQIGSNGRIVYQEQTPGSVLRQYSISSIYGINRNFDGDVVGAVIGLNTNGQLLNLSSYNATVMLDPATLDDRLTRGGPLARSPRQMQGMLGVQSDPRSDVTGSLQLQGGSDDAGGFSRKVGIGIGIKPSPRWSIDLTPTWQTNRSAAQYVGVRADAHAAETGGRRYLFSELDQNTVSLETRLNLTFSPSASLQVYMQPFISAGDYGTPMQLQRPRTFAFDVFGEDVGTVTATAAGYTIDPDGTGPAQTFTVPNGDFNIRSLRGNAVFRWEWRAGSTMFVAWQQSRSDHERYGDFDLDRDGQALFRTVPDNVLVLKVSYWLNP